MPTEHASRIDRLPTLVSRAHVAAIAYREG